MVINRKKEAVTVQGSSWKIVKREKVCEVIWKPTQPFIFTLTAMAGMEGETTFLFSLVFNFQMRKYYISKIANNFHPTTPSRKVSHFPKPHSEGMQHYLRFPIWLQIKYNLILLSKTKTNRTIASYRRYYRSFYLLPPLVFTVTALETSLFKAPERQYSSFKKIQVGKNFHKLALHPQTPQLNYSLASLVHFRSLRFMKNSELFLNSYFAPCQ